MHICKDSACIDGFLAGIFYFFIISACIDGFVAGIFLLFFYWCLYRWLSGWYFFIFFIISACIDGFLAGIFYYLK